MKRVVRAEPEADQDVQDAAMWYDSERAGLGEDFVNDIHQLTARIAENALQFPVVRDVARRGILSKFPYGVYFVVENGIAVVIAVIHLHRDSTAWTERLKKDG